MPWKTNDVESERRLLIQAWATRRYRITQLAKMFGISERIAGETVRRFVGEGPAGLLTRSKARHTQARTDAVVEAIVVDMRRKHPDWGPRKLRPLLELDYPDITWPAASTIGAILDRRGLIAPRRRRRRTGAAAAPCVEAVAPNDSWSMDFKGQFRVGNEGLCYPLTVTDNCSRYILKCKALTSTKLVPAWSNLLACFREHGLPMSIRSDNGPPFGSASVTRLSTMAVRLIKLGVFPDFIAPGKPQQNGRHERMHRTLKQATAAPPASSMQAQQRRFKLFVEEFNNRRPHEALAHRTPASVHQRSPRELPRNLPRVEYDEHVVTRAVHNSGCFKWGGEWVFIGEPLIGERVAFEPIDDALHLVRFSTVAAAIFDERTLTLRPAGYGPVVPGQVEQFRESNRTGSTPAPSGRAPSSPSPDSSQPNPDFARPNQPPTAGAPM